MFLIVVAEALRTGKYIFTQTAYEDDYHYCQNSKDIYLKRHSAYAHQTTHWELNVEMILIFLVVNFQDQAMQPVPVQQPTSLQDGRACVFQAAYTEKLATYRLPFLTRKPRYSWVKDIEDSTS